MKSVCSLNSYLQSIENSSLYVTRKLSNNTTASTGSCKFGTSPNCGVRVVLPLTKWVEK